MYFDEILDHFKCGKKIRRTSWPIGVLISRNFDSINIKDLLADDWEVVEEKNKNKWWEPELDEKYYMICGDGSIDYNNYDFDGADRRIMGIGNCFQTEEQADFMVAKLKVIHELEKFAYENNEEEIDWNDTNQEKLYLTMNYTDKCIDIFYTYGWIYSPSNIYFTSKKIAKEAIETIGEERIKKYYFGVNEDGRK